MDMNFALECAREHRRAIMDRSVAALSSVFTPGGPMT